MSSEVWSLNHWVVSEMRIEHGDEWVGFKEIEVKVKLVCAYYVVVGIALCMSYSYWCGFHSLVNMIPLTEKTKVSFPCHLQRREILGKC